MAVVPSPYLLESGDELLLESGEPYLLEHGFRFGRVREKPPLRLDIDIESPDGRHTHWSDTEPSADRAPSALRCSSTMPGGFESLDVVLARKSDLRAHDLERLSTVTVHGAGGEIAWQGRLERAPSTSGEQMSVSPGCVGWQAHLEDDKAVTEVYVDRDLSHWGPMSRARRAAVLPQTPIDPTIAPDQATGIPALVMSDPTGQGKGEAVYDAGPRVTIAAIYYDYTDSGLAAGSTSKLYSSDTVDALTEGTSDIAGSSASGYFTPLTARRFAKAYFDPDQASPAEAHWRQLAVYGTSVPRRGGDPGGVWASDVVAHALTEFCPLLTFTEGGDGTIRPTSFVIPHLAFPDLATVAEIVRGAARFELQDWAVWDNRMFYFHGRGDFGRSWRARASNTRLEGTGPQIDRLWNGVVVEYQEGSGVTRTVGPPGSGCDTVSADLLDDDPENPANELEVNRWTKLQMGTSTPSGAIKVGQRFLEETKALDSSGRAQLVGYVIDSRGVLHPASRVRGGDTISFVDSNDPSERRIVRADYTHADRTCSIDLDAPPDALDALLARLDVVLAPLGVG